MKHLILYAVLSLLLLSRNAVTQGIGGGNDLLFQLDGSAEYGLFGHSVSEAGDVNGDGFNDLIVGAYNIDSQGRTRAGEACVFSGMDGTLLLRFFGERQYDQFGFSVSGAGDVNGDGFADLIVGANTATEVLGGEGAAYVFSGVDGAMLYQFQGVGPNENFGTSVSDAGDVNGDGYPDLIIGAKGAQPGGLVNAGSVFVYSGRDGALLQQWDGAAVSDLLGNNVSGAGDVNGDGFSDLIFQAFGTDPGGISNAGSAYVYSGATGSLLHRFDGDIQSGEFGKSVSSSGDLNRDGYDDLIIGAGKSGTAGKVYVYSGFDASLLFQWESGHSNNDFGRSVSDVGDFDLDGTLDVIVGDPYASPGGNLRAGSAYVFSGANGSLLYQSDGEFSDDLFGYSVGEAGDVNGDGQPDVIVGAYRAGPSGVISAGSVYIFGFSPYMTPEMLSFSSANGAIMGYQLDFPQESAFENYKVLLSVSGTGPFHFGVDIPLTLDDQVIQTYYGIYPFQFYSDLQGSLDENGDAYATFGVLPGSVSSLIGRTFHLAAIVFAKSGPPHLSSIAVPFTIDP